MNLQFSVAVYCGASEAGIVPKIKLSHFGHCIELGRNEIAEIGRKFGSGNSDFGELWQERDLWRNIGCWISDASCKQGVKIKVSELSLFIADMAS